VYALEKIVTNQLKPLLVGIATGTFFVLLIYLTSYILAIFFTPKLSFSIFLTSELYLDILNSTRFLVFYAAVLIISIAVSFKERNNKKTNGNNE